MSTNEMNAASRTDRPTPAPPPPAPVPRGPRVWALALTALLVLGALAAGVIFREPLLTALKRVEAVALRDTDANGDGAVAAEGDDLYYTCGMHPWVILPNPGLCPICHMDLTPLDPAKFAGEIAIDPVIVQNIGVRVAPVVEGPITRVIRTVGTVAYDESSVRDVNTKVGGWIEELLVDETGVRVEAGQPLFSLYSPELHSAQEEYLVALRNLDRVDPTVLPEAAESARRLFDAARTRLAYFDVTEEQVQRLEETGEPTKNLVVASPHEGTVIDKHATEGMKIEPGMRVYRIADLSRVWVMVTVYEKDLPFVEVGQPATMTLPYVPDETFQGEVVYVYPYLDEGARAARVRLEFPNPDGRLKPGMFATVRLERTIDEDAVLVPREAIVGTGEERRAFVSLGGGRFEPREVELGSEASEGSVAILKGLEPGERVVISGQFLLDSESKMRSALVKMIEGDLASEQEVAVTAAEPAGGPVLPEAAAARLAEVVREYFAVGGALASDTLAGVDARAASIADAAEDLPSIAVPGAPHFWHEHAAEVEAIAAHARALAEAGDIDAARRAYGLLSPALADLLSTSGVPAAVEGPVDRLVCGMVPDVPEGGVWLQPGAEDVRNPYMGEMMLRCNQPAKRLRLAAPTEERTTDEDPDAEGGA